MIIDMILERKDGGDYNPYNAREFYYDLMMYGEVGWGITRAMDNGEERDVNLELKKYIVNNGYNHKICDYIDEVKWL